MGSPKILIFGERRKCCDLNSRASSLSQATDDEAVAIDFGELRVSETNYNEINKISAQWARIYIMQLAFTLYTFINYATSFNS